MFENPSLTTRILIGKSLGFLIGLIGFFLIPLFLPDAGYMLRFGVLFWYTTIGAVIGLFGVYDHHPVLRLPLPWWLRSTFLGGWMNLLLTLFTYDQMALWMTQLFGVNGALQSPFWFTVEGMIVGLLIGYFATRFGGEGKATVASLT